MFNPDEYALRIADTTARAHFVYQEDPVGTDVWTSHADEALSGVNWRGDCDDLASTALDLLCRAHRDADLSKLYRLCVKSPQCPPGVEYDHMVAGCMVRTGVLWLFGDTFGPPMLYASSPHRIMRFASLAEGVVWRAGHP